MSRRREEAYSADQRNDAKPQISLPARKPLGRRKHGRSTSTRQRDPSTAMNTAMYAMSTLPTTTRPGHRADDIGHHCLHGSGFVGGNLPVEDQSGQAVDNGPNTEQKGLGLGFRRRSADLFGENGARRVRGVFDIGPSPVVGMAEH